MAIQTPDCPLEAHLIGCGEYKGNKSAYRMVGISDCKMVQSGLRFYLRGKPLVQTGIAASELTNELYVLRSSRWRCARRHGWRRNSAPWDIQMNLRATKQSLPTAAVCALRAATTAVDCLHRAGLLIRAHVLTDFLVEVFGVHSRCEVQQFIDRSFVSL